MTPGKGTGAVVSTVASLASLVAALSCAAARDFAACGRIRGAASLFSEQLRPWLLVFSVAALIFAFVQTYYRRRCEFRHRRLRTVLLWFSAVLVVAMLIAPRTVSTVLAGRLPSFTAAGAFTDFDPAAFQKAFDAASNQNRVVVLLSPT